MADSADPGPGGDGAEPDPRFTFADERTFLAWSRGRPASCGHSPARRLSADGMLANFGVSLMAKTVVWGRMKQGPPHV